MEQIVKLHVKKLPEGYFLATSDDIQGLVAQGKTLTETLEVARDVAKKLVEAQFEKKTKLHLKQVTKSFDYPLVVNV